MLNKTVLPAAAVLPALQTAAPAKRILVADDEEGMRDILTRMLTGMGFEVDTARTGREALERLSEDFPDLLILDLKMPDLDGIEVLGAMQRAGWRVPTVMLSGLGDIDLAKLSLRLGASIYLTKPFDPADLQRTVEWYLSAAGPFDPR